MVIAALPVSQKESNRTTLSLKGGVMIVSDQYRLISPTWTSIESIFSRTEVYTASVSVVKISSVSPSRIFFEHASGRRPACALE